MKRLLLATFCLIAGISLYAQTAELNHLYDTYRGEEDVISLYIPGFACRLAARVGEVGFEEEKLLNSIRSIRLQVVENKEINQRVNYVRDFSTGRAGREYIPMLEVHEGDQDVLILAKLREDAVKELVILVGGEENVMVWIKGRMDQDLMKNLFEVTGIEHTRLTKEI